MTRSAALWELCKKLGNTYDYYNTKDGDVLDDICYRFYGHLDGTVEKVLEANDFLGFQPPVLPAGLKIQLPEINDKKSTQTVRLW